jgi:hypothetical protein
MNEDLIVRALAAKTGFEVVRANASPTSIRLIGRVPQARQKADLIDGVIRFLAVAMRTESWVVDVSKLYFVPEGHTETFYSWRFIFETKDAEKVLPVEQIASAIMRAPCVASGTGNGPLQEIKLAGASSLRQGVSNTGKGAAPMGKAVVGPMRRGY